VRIMTSEKIWGEYEGTGQSQRGSGNKTLIREEKQEIQTTPKIAQAAIHKETLKEEKHEKLLASVQGTAKENLKEKRAGTAASLKKQTGGDNEGGQG